MNNTKLNISLFFAFMGIALFPINYFYSLVAGLLVVSITFFYLKDKEITAKVMQPVLLTGALILVKGFFSCISQIFMCIYNMDKTIDFYRFITGMDNVLDFIVLLLTLAVIVICLVYFLMKKDIFFVGNLSNKIMGNKVAEKPAKVEKETAKAEKETAKAQKETEKETTKTETKSSAKESADKDSDDV